MTELTNFSKNRENLNKSKENEINNRVLYNKYKEYKNFILDNIFYTEKDNNINNSSQELLNQIKDITDFSNIFDSSGKNLIKLFPSSVSKLNNKFYEDAENSIKIVNKIIDNYNVNILSYKNNYKIYKNCQLNSNSNTTKCDKIYKNIIEPKKNIPKKFSYCYINEYLNLFIDPSNRLSDDILSKINFNITNEDDISKLKSDIKNLQFNTTYNINTLLMILLETIHLNYISFESIYNEQYKNINKDLNKEFKKQYIDSLNVFISFIKKKPIHSDYNKIPNIENIINIFLNIKLNVLNISKQYSNETKEKNILDAFDKWFNYLLLVTLHYYQSEHCYYLYNNIFEKFLNVKSSYIFKQLFNEKQQEMIINQISNYIGNRIGQLNNHKENFYIFLFLYINLIEKYNPEKYKELMKYYNPEL